MVQNNNKLKIIFKLPQILCYKIKLSKYIEIFNKIEVVLYKSDVIYLKLKSGVI